MEYGQIQANMQDADKGYEELKWEYIKTVLTEDYLAAGEQSKAIAGAVSKDLLQKYPDMAQLQYQLDFPDKVDNPAYEQIFKDGIRNKYLFNIENDNNDPFVASRKGILMDLSINCSTQYGVSRVWDSEVAGHYNKPLARMAISEILAKNKGIIFWEYLPSSNPNHYIMTSPSIEELQALYEREGIDGLKTVEFLAPAYITEAGDIFGVEDIGKLGTMNANHKIIVVQGFNLYDQITTRHAGTLSLFDQKREITHMQMVHTMVLRTFTVVGTSAILIIVAIFLMVFNNRMFHEKDFCPCGENKEGDLKE